MLEFHSNLNPQLLIQLQMSNDDHEPYMLLCMHKIFHTEYILHPSTFPLHEVTSPHLCPFIRAAPISPSNSHKHPTTIPGKFWLHSPKICWEYRAQTSPDYIAPVKVYWTFWTKVQYFLLFLYLRAKTLLHIIRKVFKPPSPLCFQSFSSSLEHFPSVAFTPLQPTNWH